MEAISRRYLLAAGAALSSPALLGNQIAATAKTISGTPMQTPPSPPFSNT